MMKSYFLIGLFIFLNFKSLCQLAPVAVVCVNIRLTEPEVEILNDIQLALGVENKQPQAPPGILAIPVGLE